MHAPLDTRRRLLRAGFTLIELLVVIAILALLLTIVLPGVTAALERARRITCLANVRNIAVASTMLREDSRSDLLPHRGDSHLNYGRAAEHLLPYTGDNPAILNCPSNKGLNHMASLELPSYPGHRTDYEFNSMLANYGPITDRVWSGITSPSEAAFVYDRPYWPAPQEVHQGGANVGYVDGRAAWLAHANMGFSHEANMFYRKGHLYGVMP